MQLTEDAFRALARSSPWRWSTLHFTRRGGGDEVEAWVRRPGWMRVRVAGRPDEVVEDELGAGTVFVALGEGAQDFTPPEVLAPQEVSPALRPDGLVAVRPDEVLIQYDDPMYRDYTWVAMLDPVELSHHTRIAELSSGRRGTREVWRSRVWADEGYEPRCGCCALLWSAISERDEAAIGGPTWAADHPDVTYPDGFRVALDVQTGVLVELVPVGGDRPDDTIEVDIHAVDASVS
jgi:hypothetical protein